MRAGYIQLSLTFSAPLDPDNTHVAVGKAIQHCYDGDPGPLTGDDWERLGFNDSVVHTDIVSTTDRQVTAVMRDGSERTIYAAGQFQLDL